MMRRLVRPVAVWGFKIIATVFLLPVLYILEPFVKVRFTHIWSDRIGHLCFNTHIFYARRQWNPEPSRTLRLIFGWKPCNETLFRLWQRVLPLHRSRLLSALHHFTKDVPGWSRFRAPMPHNLNDYREIDYPGAILHLNSEEERRGRRLLEEMGADPDGWFVAFHCRDEAFHAERASGTFIDARRHRNADVSTYLEAARRIARRGGYAIRMGSLVDKPLPDLGEPRIVDYATHHRSDFGDIYLCARTRFFLGSSSGMHSIPPLFDVPVGMAQQIPGIPVALKRQSRYILKMLRDKTTGTILPYREWQRLGLFDVAQLRPWDIFDTYESHGVEVVDNTAEDVADLAEEMLDRHDGLPDPEEGVRLQEEFIRRFVSYLPDLEHAPRLSARYALKYRALIES